MFGKGRKVKELPHGEFFVWNSKLEKQVYLELMKEFESLIGVDNGDRELSCDMQEMGFCSLPKNDRKVRWFIITKNNVMVTTLNYRYSYKESKDFKMMKIEDFNRTYGRITAGTAMTRYTELNEYLTARETQAVNKARMDNMQFNIDLLSR